MYRPHDLRLAWIKLGVHARCKNIVTQALFLAFLLFLWMGLSCNISGGSAGEGSPADHLPPHIRRITWFGERADWSHDGKKILFLSKTYGDAYEVDVQSGIIRPLTHHFYHGGFTRALYLANGDILLSGAMTFDAAHPHLNRSEKAELWVLDRSLSKPPVPLGTKCSEGPGVSRARMHIAWAQVAEQYPEEMPVDTSRILEADIVYQNGVPRLANQRLVLDSRSLSFKCTLETQNFRPPMEEELTFSAYDYQGTEVCGIHLKTGKVVNYSNAPDQYDEPEGIFPDGNYTLVECDRQNRQGSGHIDLWKLRLDGSGSLERLTHFSDFPGYKASNPVVSDDGRFMAFQMGKSKDPAGVGYGIFVYDLSKTAGPSRP
jgi:Tol biopolymer transport system component